MRYFIVTYFRKADGKMDESVTVTKNCSTRDLSQASVILDFKTQRVVKCNLNGQAGMRQWTPVVEYYRQFYKDLIAQLEKDHAKAEIQS